MSPEMLNYLLNLIKKAAGQLYNPAVGVIIPAGSDLNLGVATPPGISTTDPTADIFYNSIDTVFINRPGRYEITYGVDLTFDGTTPGLGGTVNRIRLEVDAAGTALAGSQTNVMDASGSVYQEHVSASFQVTVPPTGGLPLKLNVPINDGVGNQFANIVFGIAQI